MKGTSRRSLRGGDPQLYLFGPDGALLDWSWNFEGTEVYGVAQLTGTHYLVAGDRGGDGGGSYNLSYGRSAGPQYCDPEVCPLPSGGTASGVLQPGQLKAVAFEASAGAGIAAAMGDVGRVGGFDPQLFDGFPDGLHDRDQMPQRPHRCKESAKPHTDFKKDVRTAPRFAMERVKAVPGERTSDGRQTPPAPRDSRQTTEENMKTLPRLALATLLLATAASARAQWVSGHFRSNGSYVAPY